MTDQQAALPNLPGYGCWYEIPCTDLDASQKFYEAVLGISMIKEANTALPNPMVWFQHPETPGTLGHLYPGTPAKDGSGNTVHILSTDPLEDVMPRVEVAGGKVVSPIVPLPVGRFVYITDPDGNSIGLFNWKQQ